MTFMTYSIAQPERFTAAEAKANFAECVRRAERGEPVVITRHGKGVAAIVTLEDLRRIQRLRAAGSQGGLAGLAGGFEGSMELVAILDGLRRTPPRRPPRLR